MRKKRKSEIDYEKIGEIIQKAAKEMMKELPKIKKEELEKIKRGEITWEELLKKKKKRSIRERLINALKKLFRIS